MALWIPGSEGTYRIGGYKVGSGESQKASKGGFIIISPFVGMGRGKMFHRDMELAFLLRQVDD